MHEDQRPLIVHVVYRFDVGGLENGIVNLINRLDPARFRHAVLALTEVSDFRRRVLRDDVQYVAVRKLAGHGWRIWPRLYAEFRRLRPAIVHTRNLAALEATVPAWAARVPIRIHGEHGRDVSDLDGQNRKLQLVRRVYRPFVHEYVALSHELERYLIERIDITPARIRHIWNGVDIERFRPAATGRLPIPGCPFQDPSLFLVGSVGRMEAVKDHGTLARAFVRAVRRDPLASSRLRLVLIGDGSRRAEVEGVIGAAGLASLVWFAGERDDVAHGLRGLDCFVLPSLAEGISNTILEAMATGLPVIATRVGANAEMVQDGVTGRIVARADADAMADAILEYLGDTGKVRTHGAEGRRVIERRFALERMVEEYDRLYTEALARHVRSPVTVPRNHPVKG